MSKINITMPQPGETITQGNIVQWLVKPGDTIKQGQNIVELETEKAVFEFESPFEGVLGEILVPAGKSAPVGSPIATIEVDAEKAKTYAMFEADKPKPATSKQAAAPKAQAAPTAASAKQTGQPPKLSPLIRSLMAEHHLSQDDLMEIEPTGPQGRLTKEDVLAYVKEHKAPPIDLGEDVEIKPCSAVRARIAENMVLSKKTIPHAHFSMPVDVTKVVEYREKHKKAFQEKHGYTLGYTNILFPSLKELILKHPLVNASFVDRGSEKFIGIHHKINMGIAVGTENGLYVPVIPHAEKMDAEAFNEALDGVLKRAQANRLKVSDLTGVTFTFNNYGYYGTTIGMQVIVAPQSTTLGMGQIQKRPWVVGDKIEIRYISDLTLAFDHRILDGRDAGLFLMDLKKAWENFA